MARMTSARARLAMYRLVTVYTKYVQVSHRLHEVQVMNRLHKLQVSRCLHKGKVSHRLLK
jgi:hypothetical protein